MDYIYNNATLNLAFFNLIKLDSQIYDLNIEMRFLEKEGLLNSAKYKKCLDLLHILKTKEKRILDNIGDKIDLLDFCDDISNIIKVFTDDKDKCSLIEERIINIFSKKDLKDNYYMFMASEQYIDNYFHFYNEHLIDFICFYKNEAKTEDRLLYSKYKNIFTNPDIEDEFLYAGFNEDNIIDLPFEDKAASLNVDIVDYELDRASFYYNYAEDFIRQFIKKSTDVFFPQYYVEEDKIIMGEDIERKQKYFDNILNQLDEFEVLLPNIDTYDLIELKRIYRTALGNDNSVIIYNNTTAIQELDSLINDELAIREDYDVYDDDTYELSDNQAEIDKLDMMMPKEADMIFKLIKKSYKICTLIGQLGTLELLNKDRQKKLKELEREIKIESKLAKNIASSNIERETLKNILDEYMDIALASEEFDNLEAMQNNKNIYHNLIQNRIRILIPDIDIVDNTIYKTPAEPHFILQNHMANQFKEFQKLIDTTPLENRENLIKVKYEEIACDPDFTLDFVNAKGKVENITALDDETSAELSGIDLDEYIYDKEELLFNFSKDVIKNLALADINDITPYTEAMIKFQSIYIMETIKQLDEDRAVALKYVYDTMCPKMPLNNNHSPLTFTNVKTKEKKL